MNQVDEFHVPFDPSFHLEDARSGCSAGGCDECLEAELQHVYILGQEDMQRRVLIHLSATLHQYNGESCPDYVLVERVLRRLHEDIEKAQPWEREVEP